MITSDVIVVGAGILGLATARELLLRAPGSSVVVLEKEPRPATHQTGRNSGVLHSGIYYAEGSQRARNCIAGKELMEAFCAEHDIPTRTCGKVIIAADEHEERELHRILDRGTNNGVRCELLDPNALRHVEPHAAGVAAIHVPEAGIVDFSDVSRALAHDVRSRGGTIVCDAGIQTISGGQPLTLRTARESYQADHVFTCAGLYADRLAAMTGHAPDLKIVPFRGEYYALKPAFRYLCRGLIYPVPDPDFPFLGVHLTPRTDGGVDCGPNAVLALAREGYTWSDVHAGELLETLVYRGLRRLALRHFGAGMRELRRSLSRRLFAESLQRLVPAVEPDMLEAAPAGVRAQALNRDGELVRDFVFRGDERVTHVCNAPSPAATASLAIARTIVTRAGYD